MLAYLFNGLRTIWISIRCSKGNIQASKTVDSCHNTKRDYFNKVFYIANITNKFLD